MSISYSYPFLKSQNESMVGRIKSTNRRNIENDIDQMVGYQFGDYYPNSDTPIGVVVKTNPIVILSFDERRERVDTLCDNFDYNHRKWSKIGWYIPSIEEMRFIFQNQDKLNNAIESANIPNQPEYDWDDDDFVVPRYDFVPNPYNKELIKNFQYYMTREQHSNDGVYWKCINSRGSLDFCSWVDSENCCTRILGEVRPLSESMVGRIRNSSTEDLNKDVDSEIVSVETDKEMIDFLNIKFDLDLYRVFRGQDRYASEEDDLYDNMSFVPETVENDNTLTQLYCRCFPKQNIQIPDSLFFGLDYDDEDGRYYLKVCFELQYNAQFCYWIDLSHSLKNRILKYIISSTPQRLDRF